LRLLTNLYAKATRNLGRHPKDEQEFRDAIGKMDLSLDLMKVSSVDQLFVSERDGQPFVVLYGPLPQTQGSDVIAYEQTGVDGKRMVGHKIGMVEEVDEARFRELVPSGPTAPQ
jgi:hypothetical protein